MSKYIDQIIHLVETQTNKADNIAIIRLEGFENPNIYKEVCKHFKASKNINITAKLSKEKYNEFKNANNPEYDSAMTFLDTNKFVDYDGAMTKWRNKSTELEKVSGIRNLVLLMGTESVEDKGGLADFFKVTPESILKMLKSNYASWFTDIIEDAVIDKDIKKGLNTFFKVLFKNININLLTLSELIEELKTIDITTADELIEEICFRLSKYFGIPSIHDEKKIPKIKNLKKGTMKSAEILEKSYKFITRIQFSKGINDNSFKTYTAKIENYGIKNVEDTDCGYPEENPIFKNYEDFKDSLLNFMTGKDYLNLRDKFMQFDFGIIDTVLNLKLQIGGEDNIKVIKDKENKLFGEPIEIYSEMILKTVLFYKSEYKELPEEVVIKVNSVKITNCNEENTEEKETLLNRVKLRLAGIVEYIKQGISIEVKYYEDKDPFSVNEKDGFTVGYSDKINELSKIQFSVVASNSEEDKSRRKEFLYCYSNLDSWFSDCLLIEQDLLVEEISDRSLPLYAECTNINQYVNCEVDEEFFMKLPKINYQKVNLDIITELASVGNHYIDSEFALLREEYKSFIKEFNEKGFYNTLLEVGTSKKVFIRYANLLKVIREHYSTLTSTQKGLIKIILNLFLIGDKNFSEFKNFKNNIMIMAPTHPVMLEKIFYMQEHIRKSINELVELISIQDITSDKDLDKRLDYVFKMSTINTGFDVFSFDEKSNLQTGDIYGRYVVYSQEDDEFNILTDNGVRNDLIEQEEQDKKSIKKRSHKSEIVSQSIIDYINTFPARADGINLLFINPDEIQHIVAGINTALDYFNNKEISININLRILVSAERRSGEGYLKYWLDTHEQSDNSSKLKTFINYIKFDSNKLYEQIKSYTINQDLSFLYNILENVSVDFIQALDNLKSNEIKYPAIVTPMPLSITQELRAVDISQRQFASSQEHLQLTHKILRPNEVEGMYRAIKKKEIKDAQKEIIANIHNESKWVVCLDETIDKNILNSEGSKVIGFSTGKGLFGELNTTVSARFDVLEDLQHKLKYKLMSKFTKWIPEVAEKAASNCIEISKNLDGSKMLKALNPRSTEIHNFLAYVMTIESIHINTDENKNVIKVLLNLDNYLHWFDDSLVVDLENNNKINNKIRPDFMVLEIEKNEALFTQNEPLKIKATVIECKMSKENEEYIEEAIEQVKIGVEKLAKKFNPKNMSVNRRYWFNQLYRSLVFSKINMKDNEDGYDVLINKLSSIFEGNFEIEWHGRIYAYWLDVNDNSLNKRKISIGDTEEKIKTFEVYTAGQLFVQKILLPKNIRNEIEFEFTTEEVEEDSTFNIEILGEERESESIETTEIKEVLELVENNEKIEEVDVTPKIDVTTTNDDEKPEVEDKSDILIESKPQVEDKEELVSNNVEEQVVNQNARFLLGEDLRTKEKIYWEYMNKQLNNRHLLINGNSGSGKTYCIQTLILEAVKNNISVIVFDYTDGFTDSKLSPILLEKLGDKFEERYVKYDKFPINPFKRRVVKVRNREAQEPAVDVANRIASSFKNVYKFGPQQRNTIYSAVIDGINEYGDNMTLERLAEKLEEIQDSTSGTTLSKIRPLVDYNPFEAETDFSWDNIIQKKGGMYVIQLSGFDREIQVILTDLILWDIWNYAVACGNETTPIPIVLDEAQNLSHSEDTPSGKILAEGRKFGLSGWYATQFMKGRLTPGEIGNLQQAAQKLYFSPPEESIVEVSKYIDITNDGSKMWAEKLTKMVKGQCVTAGYKDNNGKWDKYQPRIIKVTSLEDRIND